MNHLIFCSFVKEAVALKVQKNSKTLSSKETKDIITQLAHRPNIEKKANMAVNALELGGLGILAAPGFKTLRNNNASAEEKSHAKIENAGLGVLAAHPAYETAKYVGGKTSKAVSGGISKLRSAGSSVMRAASRFR
jgi:hypothetical protein